MITRDGEMKNNKHWLSRWAWIFCGFFLLIQLSGCSPRDPFPMKKVDWAHGITGSGNVNMITHLDPNPEHPETRRYWTGGTSAGSTPMSKWPERQISRAEHGNATVRLYAFADDEPTDADARAMQIARVVSSAASIWPGAGIRVEIDVHLVPEDVSYGYARLITWEEDAPFRLTLFLKANRPESGLHWREGEAAAHELYHVMQPIVGRGAPPAPDDNTGLLHMTDEAFAEVFAACGSLLANGERNFHRMNASITIDGKKYQGHLTGEEIRYFFDRYVDTHIIKFTGPIMAGSAFRAIYGDQTLIRPDDPAGQEMLALCARVAPDHARLADWLLALDR